LESCDDVQSGRRAGKDALLPRQATGHLACLLFGDRALEAQIRMIGVSEVRVLKKWATTRVPESLSLSGGADLQLDQGNVIALEWRAMPRQILP
jgi:hypothetical protein